MSSNISETSRSNKNYILFETDDEGIKIYNSVQKSERAGTSLAHMHIAGRIVPAIRLETDDRRYDSIQRDQWKEEHRRRQESRCIICGHNGRSRFCPLSIPNPEYTDHEYKDPEHLDHRHNNHEHTDSKHINYEYNGHDQNSQELTTRTISNCCSCCPHHISYRARRSHVLFSMLTVTDTQGREEPFEPVSPYPYDTADHYISMLYGFIDYIRIHHPSCSRCARLVELLGHEYTLTEASRILGIPYRTLYGWLRALRPIFDEYTATISYR